MSCPTQNEYHEMALSYLFMVEHSVCTEHSISALELEVVLVFITIYLHIYLFFIENSEVACVYSSLRTHIDLLLSTEVAFLQPNIGHQNLF